MKQPKNIAVLVEVTADADVVDWFKTRLEDAGSNSAEAFLALGKLLGSMTVTPEAPQGTVSGLVRIVEREVVYRIPTVPPETSDRLPENVML